ncbi:hypothetical protein FZW96_07735 [Bacillus sp. BGMRC 2118]|nr:hypothetical protein FZW96_07735 [Bacillus sp. BGMRC 2118]
MTSSPIRLICIDDIEAYYTDPMDNLVRARQILHATRVRELFPISVEKLQNGTYQLISGSKVYEAYNKLYPGTYIPIVMLPTTTEIERLIKIITISIPLEKGTSWLFKNEHIMLLLERHNLSVEFIARETNLPLSVINNYVLDRRIPPHIRPFVIERGAKTVVDKICRSRLFPEQVRSILFEKAILLNPNSLRLDGKKYEYFKQFYEAVHNRIPIALLNDSVELEKFIDMLLITNFDLEHHWRSLLERYIENRHF